METNLEMFGGGTLQPILPENITFGDPLAAGDPLSYGQDTTLAKNLNLTHEKTIQNIEDLENRNIVSVFSILRGIQGMAENYIEENLNNLENSVDIDMNNEISDSIEKHSDDFRIISEHKLKEVHESKIKNTGEDISRSLEKLRHYAASLLANFGSKNQNLNYWTFIPYWKLGIEPGLVLGYFLELTVIPCFRDFLYESFVALTKTVLMCGTALALGVMPGPSRGNLWPIFNPQVYGPEISTYITDPYTFLHYEDGIIAYLLWGWWGWTDPPFTTPFELSPMEKAIWDDFGGLLLGLIAGYLFEVAENSDYVINEVRANHGTSQFYQGDSRLNSFVDILALGIGYSMTKVCFEYGLGWFPVLWLVISETISFLTFRDNLLLSLIQLIHPMEWIKNYQEGLVPDHLKDVMRVGYWNNKLRDSPNEFLNKLMHSPKAQNKFATYSREHLDLTFSSLDKRCLI